MFGYPDLDAGLNISWFLGVMEFPKSMRHLGPSYTIPDRYRSGVTFVSDRGLSYTTPHQSDTQRSD